jgi:hypothetical protein
MRKILTVTFIVAAIGCWGATGALGARNPVGHGQPGTASPEGASCGAEGSTASPKGFETGGFELAESRYAGSEGTPSAEHGSVAHAISEYDIACYQQTQNH